MGVKPTMSRKKKQKSRPWVIQCPQQNQQIRVDGSQTLMDHLLQEQVPVASSCNGEGICGKCLMHIEATPSLPAPKGLEEKTLYTLAAPKGWRLSCQWRPDRDCLVKTTYW